MNEIKKNMLKHEEYLSDYACFDKDAIRLKKDSDDDIRSSYFRDVDRIIHSLSYTRYMDKTQVFSFEDNDNLSKRIVHVQLVSKIARTIGRALNLNEDLIEAMALGHDIGHTPFGHSGEEMLNRISLERLGEMFNHNIQSVRTYLTLENNGKGNNLTIQTLDGIMCHNGEIVEGIYKPIKKTKDEFLEEYQKCYTDKEVLKKVRPMTLEGCVVRISDVIGYIGRDIEDAINIGKLKRSDIPEHIKNTLGTTNKEIVNTIILDIIKNSYKKDYIKLSDDVFKAIFDLKNFNYENIYSKANSYIKLNEIEQKLNILFDKYMLDLKEENKDSDIYKVYLNNMSKEYLENTKNERKIIDYIAGMTDEYLLKMFEVNNVEIGDRNEQRI